MLHFAILTYIPNIWADFLMFIQMQPEANSAQKSYSVKTVVPMRQQRSRVPSLLLSNKLHEFSTPLFQDRSAFLCV